MPIRSPSLLFDTHAWIWAMEGDPRAKKVEGFSGQCAVSVMSVWEVGMLVCKNRLDLEPTVEDWVRMNLRPPVTLQPLTPGIALASTRLEDFHGDPVDRMLVATALTTGQPLVTADRKILEWFADRKDMAHLVEAL